MDAVSNEIKDLRAGSVELEKRGRKPSDGGARARFYREVCDAHLARIVRVDLKSELFTYDISEKALAHARLMDGKWRLVTNLKFLPQKNEFSLSNHR